MKNEETDEIAKDFVSLTTLSMLSCKPIVFLLSGLCDIISPEPSAYNSWLHTMLVGQSIEAAQRLCSVTLWPRPWEQLPWPPAAYILTPWPNQTVTLLFIPDRNNGQRRQLLRLQRLRRERPCETSHSCAQSRDYPSGPPFQGPNGVSDDLLIVIDFARFSSYHFFLLLHAMHSSR
jgi:hypothetical protein